MPLPSSLVQQFRQGQLQVGNGWRCYFAPFNQALAVTNSSTSVGPTVWDLQVVGKFIGTSASLPVGWFDLGFIDKVKINPDSKISNIMSGYRNAVRAKYRADVGEKCSFVFREAGRLQYNIATGEGAFNLLKSTAPASTIGPLSSSGVAAIAMGASGYIASGAVAGYVGQPVLYVPGGSGALFPAGTYIVADQDYTNQFGFVGDAGVNVFQGAVTDVDYIRKTSDYVATVKAVVTGAQDALVLTKPFAGGGNTTTATQTVNTGPSTGAKVQQIIGFGTRGGGTTIKEWSAIMVKDTIDGSQILIYYPRLAPDKFGGFDDYTAQGGQSIIGTELNASFESMAFDDPIDGETVVRYSFFFPHTSPAIDIQN